MSRPMEFIVKTRNNELVLNEKAIEEMQKVTKHLVVVAIAGKLYF